MIVGRRRRGLGQDDVFSEGVGPAPIVGDIFGDSTMPGGVLNTGGSSPGSPGFFSPGGLFSGLLSFGGSLTKDILTLRPPAGTVISATGPGGQRVYTAAAPVGAGILPALPSVGGFSIGTILLISLLIVGVKALGSGGHR